MIIAIIGGIGSGKSVTATMKAIKTKKSCFLNFNLRAKSKKREILRIKKTDIIKSEIIDYKKNGEPKYELKVNWDFWNDALEKYGEYHIFLDEVHNIAHSRQAMSKWNTLFSTWISQVRKVLGDSETTHIFLISQKLYRIDVAFRDLLQTIIFCEKKTIPYSKIPTLCYKNKKPIIKLLPATYIINYYFLKGDIESNFNLFDLKRVKSYNFRTSYFANPYFRFYDSYQIFGETAYL